MKQISEFIINKVTRRDEDIIELSANIDSQPQYFEVKIDKSNDGMLAEFSKDLEFLLRANDVSLSRNLIKFLKRIMKNEQLDLPVILFSESSASPKLRPRQPQTA